MPAALPTVTAILPDPVIWSPLVSKHYPFPKGGMSRRGWAYALVAVSMTSVAYATGLIALEGDGAIEKGQLLTMLGIALGTLVSEDLACIEP